MKYQCWSQTSPEVQPVLTVSCDHPWSQDESSKRTHHKKQYGESQGLSALIGLFITCVCLLRLDPSNSPLSSAVWRPISWALSQPSMAHILSKLLKIAQHGSLVDHIWQRANQSLKLTEPAVDDFAARQKNFLRKWRYLPRV